MTYVDRGEPPSTATEVEMEFERALPLVLEIAWPLVYRLAEEIDGLDRVPPALRGLRGELASALGKVEVFRRATQKS